MEALLNHEATGEARVLLSSAKLVGTVGAAQAQRQAAADRDRRRAAQAGDDAAVQGAPRGVRRLLHGAAQARGHGRRRRAAAPPSPPVAGRCTPPARRRRRRRDGRHGRGRRHGSDGRGGAARLSKGGTEIAAKAISTHLELNPTWAAFKNDFSNAFNACARRRMVEQLLKSPFGHFEPVFRLFYEHAGALYFEGERLPADSCEGAQQGDPLAHMELAQIWCVLRRPEENSVGQSEPVSMNTVSR